MAAYVNKPNIISKVSKNW